MADNTQLNPGDYGDVISTEQVTGTQVKIQRVKIATGIAGTDGGNVTTSNPLPVGGNWIGEAGTPASQVLTVQGKHGAFPLNTGLKNLFGDVAIADVEPVVQIDAAYGILSTEHETFSASSGTTTESNSEFAVACSSTAGSYGVLRSRRAVRYRGGQVSEFRFTARYSTPVALTQQMAGAFNFEQGIFVGYNGTQFGILHQHNGKAQIMRLTMTAGAAGAESLTITLNSVAFNVNVTAGSATVVSTQIAAQSFTGWAVTASVSGSTALLTFVAQTVGVKNGTYSFTNNTGGGTTAASFSTRQTGVAHTEDWYYKGSWTGDNMDGSGPSGMTLDPTKGNAFVIKQSFSGYGQIQIFILDDNDSDVELVHEIRWGNSKTEPAIRNPTYKIGWVAYNLGAGSGVAIYGTGASGFVHGRTPNYKRPTSLSNTKTGIGTSFTSILAIRNRSTFASRINLATIKPLLLSFAVDGTKPAEAQLLLNPTISGSPVWNFVDENTSAVEYDTAGTTVSNGRAELSMVLGKTEARQFYFDGLAEAFSMEPGDVLVLAVKATTGTTDASCSIVWARD